MYKKDNERRIYNSRSAAHGVFEGAVKFEGARNNRARPWLPV